MAADFLEASGTLPGRSRGRRIRRRRIRRGRARRRRQGQPPGQDGATVRHHPGPTNRGGRSFVDISGVTGLDNPADSRGFAVLDYDRDGWQDIALVNANQPLFNLYHNEMAKAGQTGGMIAIRFVGGNRVAAPSKEFSNRDGYGARVAVDLGDRKLIREHRCGDGWSTQNSATMILGIGSHTTVASLSVKWPSGKTASTQAVSEGTLLTAYENATDSPTGESFVRKPYRIKP